MTLQPPASDFQIKQIRGSGGNMNPFAAPTSPGGSGKGGSQGVQSVNTLRSAAFARLVELIGEGPIQGLINGGQSIYFNQTPVINADQTVNFRGVQWSSRVGLPDQAGLVGNATAENQTAVNVQVKFNIPPTVVTIVDVEATSARVVVSVPSLMSTDNNGNVVPTSVSWQVWCQPSGGAWQMMDQVDLVKQKCISVYQQQSIFTLPPGGCPWNIKVVRLTADSYTINLQNDTWFDSYTSVVAGNFIYPNSAVVGITVDSELFSATSIPSRSFHVQGLIIQVPSNYNPTTRVYTGIWDGTFQTLYSNNPAWVLYDLLTNNRYGIGDYIDATKIDKWSLYQIAQYCDALVPNGFGGTEPRYTFNGVLNNRQDAWKALQSVTSSFRGMIYWSVGQVFSIADMPADSVKLVAPADVIDGHFSYSGTALKTRHSVAIVKWNDPLAFWAPAVEVVVSSPQMAQFGWRETNMTAVGCTSRGQANRMGKWMLDTERYATETVEYVASWDHIDIRPGDVISVADPNKAQVRIGGRIVAVVSPGVYQLDAPFTPTVGETYTFMAEMADGTIASATVASFLGSNVTLTADFTTPAAPNTMWVLTGTTVAPMQYRVLSIAETSANLFKITALFYDPTKYARVETMQALAPIQYSQVKTVINPPNNFNANETVFFQNGIAQNNVTLSWTPSGDFMATSYLITGVSPIGGIVNFGQSTGTNFDIQQPAMGAWTFNIQSIGYDGRVSTNVSISLTVQGWATTPPPTVTMLEVFNNASDATFGGPDCHVTWQNNFPGSTFDVGQEPSTTGSGAGAVNPFYRCNIVTVSDAVTGQVFRTETVYTSDYIYTFDKNTLDNLTFNRGPQRSFSISVVVQDNLGRQSQPETLVPNNPVPGVIFPTVTSGAQTIYVNYVAPSDIDFVGAFIWCSTNSNFDPMATTPVYQGPNSFITVPGTINTTYYVRIAGYDQFGTKGLNISPPFPILVGGPYINTTPPVVPTTLVLGSSTITLPTGTIQEVLTASWDASVSPNFAYFDVQIETTGGSYISYQTTLNSYAWSGLTANVSYTVRVRAMSQTSYASAYCTPVSLTMPAKTTAPGSVSTLTATASLQAIYLSWVNPTDPDIDHFEIWSGTTSVQAASTLVGTSYGTAFTQSGLLTGTTYYYWVRAINTSGVASAYSSPANAAPGVVATGDMAANSITADRIVAGSITGNLLNVSTSFPATITIGSTGVTIGAAANPAALVNAGSTLIAPGLIQLSGATTLSSWQSGADATKIAGGSIAANSIAANSLTIGLRGLAIAGLVFSYDSFMTVVSWTAGTISYLNDAGASVLVNVSAGSFNFIGTAVYINWVKDATSLSTTTSMPSSSISVNFASYSVAVGLLVTYGRTVVDGSNVVTGSITANSIAANTIQAGNIAAGTITATQIAAATITGDRLVAGTITATQIAAGSITATQIAAGSITSTQIAAGAITAGSIAAGAITATSLGVTTLSAITANMGTVTAGIIQSTDGKMTINLTSGFITFNT